MDLPQRIRSAMLGSIELSKSGKYKEALLLVDDVITKAVEEGDTGGIETLCHHAALLSRQGADLPLRKHYYELSLVHSPENPMALYGLADAAFEEGQTDLTEKYARRCYKALLDGDDELMKQGLLDLVLNRWPDLRS